MLAILTWALTRSKAGDFRGSFYAYPHLSDCGAVAYRLDSLDSFAVILDASRVETKGIEPFTRTLQRSVAPLEHAPPEGFRGAGRPLPHCPHHGTQYRMSDLNRRSPD